MPLKTHYDTLHVSVNATLKQIRDSYRNLSRKYHPDKGGDKKIFQEISEAYQVLSDIESRRIYDLSNKFTNNQYRTEKPNSNNSSNSTDTNNLYSELSQDVFDYFFLFNNKDVKQNVWNKAKEIDGKDAKLYRQDIYGNQIYKQCYERTSKQGWCMDYIIPISKGGVSTIDNLHAIHISMRQQRL